MKDTFHLKESDLHINGGAQFRSEQENMLW